MIYKSGEQFKVIGNNNLYQVIDSWEDDKIGRVYKVFNAADKWENFYITEKYIEKSDSESVE